MIRVVAGMIMTKLGGAIVGGSHRWVRANGDRAVQRRVRVVIRYRPNCRSTIY
jgi:hypothetical protein